MPLNFALDIVFALLLLTPPGSADETKPAAKTADEPKAAAKPAEAKPAEKPTEAKPAETPKPDPTAVAKPTLSFMKDVAPILARNCIACHNPKKAESKYVMTTFAQLKKGGQRGEDACLVAGQPDESDFVTMLRPDGDPRMPYKQDPLSPEHVAVIDKWVKEGAGYDGKSPTEDWTIPLRRSVVVAIPDAYPIAVPVTALAFGPKGELAASGFHEVTFWGIDGDKPVPPGVPARRLRPLPERVYDLAYSPDGKFLATAGGDPGQFGSVALWEVDAEGRAKPVRELVESTDCVFAVAFSPDGKTLAAAGADRAIRIWEVPAGKLVATVEDHADWIFDLAFSPDGKQLASASRDKTAKVFDVAKKEALVTFPGHADAVYSIAFSADGKQVLSGGADNQVRAWTPGDEAKQVMTMGGAAGAVFKLAVLADGKTMVTVSADTKVRVYEANSLKQTLAGHKDWIYSLAVSPDGKRIATGSWDGEVRLWSLPDGKPLQSFTAAPGLKPTAQASAR